MDGYTKLCEDLRRLETIFLQQDTKYKEKEDLAEKLGKHVTVLERINASYEGRIAELERILDDKDRRIAELESEAEERQQKERRAVKSLCLYNLTGTI